MAENPSPEPMPADDSRNQALLRESTSAVAKEAMADKSEGKPPFNEVSVLFPLLTFYTVAYLGLMTAEFVLHGTFILPTGLMPIYIALTGAYAADKEIRRWAGTPSRRVRGRYSSISGFCFTLWHS